MNDIERWYEKLTYADAKNILQEKLTNIKMSFIAAGYCMKYIRDHELYMEDGYANIWEFAEDIYGIKRMTASRWMNTIIICLRRIVNAAPVRKDLIAHICIARTVRHIWWSF